MAYRLSAEETAKCRVAFDKFDKDGSGSIDLWELRDALRDMGQDPKEEELVQLMEDADDDESGSIEFEEFLVMISDQKVEKIHRADDLDTLHAFVAMGGRADKSGHVQPDRLRSAIEAFGLEIDVGQLIIDTDTDMSGFIDYEEFKAMMLGDA